MAIRVALTAALAAAVVVSAAAQSGRPTCTFDDRCSGEPMSAPAGGLLTDGCGATWAVLVDCALSPATAASSPSSPSPSSPSPSPTPTPRTAPRTTVTQTPPLSPPSLPAVTQTPPLSPPSLPAVTQTPPLSPPSLPAVTQTPPLSPPSLPTVTQTPTPTPRTAPRTTVTQTPPLSPPSLPAVTQVPSPTRPSMPSRPPPPCAFKDPCDGTILAGFFDVRVTDSCGNSWGVGSDCTAGNGLPRQAPVPLLIPFLSPGVFGASPTVTPPGGGVGALAAPAPTVTAPAPPAAPTVATPPPRRRTCTYADACDGQDISAAVGGVLVDSCGRSYTVLPDCELQG